MATELLPDELWNEIEPLLDQAMDSLAEMDRLAADGRCAAQRDGQRGRRGFRAPTPSAGRYR